MHIKEYALVCIQDLSYLDLVVRLQPQYLALEFDYLVDLFINVSLFR